MQPGYPNQPHNPMQPMAPPAPTPFPPQGYQPPSPLPQPYPQPPQPVMRDIAPPQAYAQPQAAYPAPPPAIPTNPNTTRFTPPAPRPMDDFTPPAPSSPAISPHPMQPMAPPAPTPFPPQGYQPPPQISRPQVAQNIPVQSHPPAQVAASGPQPYSPPQQRPQNPFTYPNNPSPSGVNYSDNRMDDILKDVNRNVSRPEQKEAKKNLPEITDKLKMSKLRSHAQKAATHPKPMMIVALAVITFLSLSMAAFFAFNKDGNVGQVGPEVKLVGTTAAAGDSIQAAGGTLVSPQEVEDLSDVLKKQVDGFNDSQDFNQEPLSDQALGL